MIKLIGMDLDGTLLDSNKNISRENLHAINSAIAMGVIVLPATGRHLRSIPREVLSIDGIGYAITANGAVIYSLRPEEIIHTDLFTVEKALEIYALLEGLGGLISVFCGFEAYRQAGALDALGHRLPKAQREYFASSRRPVASLRALIRQTGSVEKFTILLPDQDGFKNAVNILLGVKDVNIASSATAYLEINTGTADKGSALSFIAKRHGIKKEEILAIGDAGNDILMAEAAGTFVAMGNALPQLKEKAHFVTSSCDESGVARAIKKYVVNK